MLAVVALVCAVDATIFALAEDTLAAHVYALRASGWIAFSSLLVSLVFSPLSRFLGRNTSALRRGFGLGAFAGATWHASAALLGPLIPDPALLWYEPLYRAGSTTFVILLFLALTSFDAVNRRLRVRNWHDLHFLAYVAVLTTFHHAALSSHVSVAWLIRVSLVIALLLGVRFVSKLRSAIPM